MLSADGAAARERALLLDALAPADAAQPRPLDVVGTVADAVALIERWVLAGAADGVVIEPGSLRADVSAVVGGLLPALARRGLRTTVPAVAA